MLTEATLIGVTISDCVPGTGGSLWGCAAETHGLELSGKMIAVSYVTVNV